MWHHWWRFIVVAALPIIGSGNTVPTSATGDDTHHQRHLRRQERPQALRRVLQQNNNNVTKQQHQKQETVSQGADIGVPAYFRITVVGTIVEAHTNQFSLSDEIEQVSCIPIIDGIESNQLYSINLAPHFIQTHSDLIYVGKLYVAITNAKIIEKEERVAVTASSIITIVGNTRSDDSDNSNEYPNTTGQKTIAIVRISTQDSTPTASADKIQSTLFNPNTVNFRTQYMNCSFGQLEWVLAPLGVVEVFVNQPILDFPTGSSLVTAAQNVIADEMKIDPASLGDKVIMCLPPGTGGWIASSGVNHWRSQFNDEWCLSLTATMHEVGHMMGLIHSNEDGVAYGDSTDYMAAGHRDTDWPRKCFNGYKNWQLGWYKDRQFTLESSSLEEGHLVKLASFVDFERTDYDETVLVNIANQLYLVFNLARDFNIDTEEKRNEVTITAPGDSGSESLAGLKEKDAYRVSNFQNSNRELVVEVCTRDRGKLGSYLMWVSIAYDKSLCNEVNEESVVRGYELDIVMTESPSATPSRQWIPVINTDVPSLWPSDYPSEMPSLVPSENPSGSPTNSPSTTPSHSPSKYPTISPSNVPTNPPTTSPPPSEGSIALPPPTALPTKIDYQELLKKREKKINDGTTVKLNEIESLFDGKNR